MSNIPRRSNRVAIPDTRSVKDPATAKVLTAVIESLQVLAGERGNGYDRAVTVRELTEEGNVYRVDNGKLKARDHVVDPSLPGNGSSEVAVLPEVSELTVMGLYEQVVLSWSYPTNLMQYIAHFEVWRAPINDRAAATLVGQSNFLAHVDVVGEGVEVYYWVRGVSTDNIATAWNAAEGTKAVTELPPEKLIEKVRGEIDDSVLATDLKTKIDNSALQAAEALEEITTVGNTLGGVQQTLRVVQTRANLTYAQWSVKAQIGDMVYGVGLLANNNGADFGVSATRFFMYDPTASNPYKQYPFMVSGGRVYINSAVIKDASITTAKVRNFGAEVINGIKANISELNADFVTLNNGVITGEIQSANYSYGSKGWRLTQSGNLYAFGDDVEFGGKLRAASGTFSGSLTANAVNAVNTINLAGNTVRVASAANMSGNGPVTITVDMRYARAGSKVIIQLNGTSGSYTSLSSDSRNTPWIRVQRNGSTVASGRRVVCYQREHHPGNTSYTEYRALFMGLSIDTPGPGIHVYTISGNNIQSATCVIDGAKA